MSLVKQLDETIHCHVSPLNILQVADLALLLFQTLHFDLIHYLTQNSFDLPPPTMS